MPLHSILATAIYLACQWIYNAILDCRGLPGFESSAVASVKPRRRDYFGYFACLLSGEHCVGDVVWPQS